MEQQGELIIVTGMTGAGRSTAAKELEDLGYFVVDNLPPELVSDVVRLLDEKQGVGKPIAAVVDVRAGTSFDSLREQLAKNLPGGAPRSCSSRPMTASWCAARRPPAARTRSRAPAGSSRASTASAR